MKKIKSTLWQGSGKFLSLFIIQIALLVVSNLFLIKNNLDCDCAKLMTHIVKMWDHRTLVIPDWNYSTTIEWDCTSIFAIPFYAVTKNIFLSCGLSNILLASIFLFSVYYLVKDKSRFLVTANILLIPFSTGMLDYFNMMFFGGSQYIVKVMVPIMMLGIILRLEEEGKLKAKDLAMMILYGLLLLCTSMSSGIYVLAAGIAAIVVGYILYKLRNFEKVSVKSIIFIALTMVIYLLGMLINQAVLGGSRGEGMKLCPAYEITGNVISNFFGLFELAGGLTKEWYMSVFSLAGVLTLAKFLFTVILICTAILLARKIVKGQLDIMSTILTLIFFWNVLIMFTVKTRAGSATTEYRYYLIGFVPMIIAMVEHFYPIWESDKICNRKTYTSLLLLVSLAFVSCGSFLVFMSKEDTSKDLKILANYCDEADFDMVYLYDGSNDSDVLRALDQSREYICLLDNGQTYAADYYARYCFGGVQKENSIVVVDTTQYDFEDEFMILDMELIKVDEVANRKIYIFN